MNPPGALDGIQVELHQAREAGAEGPQGRARVCGRRAAGWAVGGFPARGHGRPIPRGAYELLRGFRSLDDVPVELSQAATHLTACITPDRELPQPQDPLEDAQRLANALWGNVEQLPIPSQAR